MSEATWQFGRLGRGGVRVKEIKGHQLPSTSNSNFKLVDMP